MVRGLGVDIVQIERIGGAFERFGQRLVDRLLSKQEQAMMATRSDPVRFIAGRFAAKEALTKALGTILQVRPAWSQMQILADWQGRPVIVMESKVPETAPELRFHVSISHERDYAVAVVVVESEAQA